MSVREVTTDLLAEHDALDAIVAPLPDEAWAMPTPSPRWTVADQIGHLTYFDGTATLAITDPDAFAAVRDELLASVDGGEELTLGPGRAMSPAEVLAAWRENRRRLADAAATLDDGTRVVWYGPSMGAKSFLTARLMETWAHGQDIVDAVGASRPPTDRLRHIAQLGFITRGWSYVNRGLAAPEAPVFVELVAPSGATWTWGPADASDRVRGPAEDFCVVVTQRRHVDDTALVVEGTNAREWLLCAQAFAGPPTDGPASRTA
ncbi:MAG TPA: TIGR03084 family metal-binding protein [Ilumatobacteraceae bacterium]|nr:TIGR03084 family metal-binding protein [Ilumatobacteraceae bacterium]